MNSVSGNQLREQYDLLRTEYIKLLNDKDVYLNWGKPQLEALYSTRIGYLQIEKLQHQLHIKALKRKIELVHASINQNKTVDINEIELNVAAELAEVEFKIMNDVAKVEKAKKLLSSLESPERSAELRKLYKQIAKQLHPDVNDKLTEQQKDLWHKVMAAYGTGDLEQIKTIQVVYEKEIAATGDKIAELTDEEISSKIEVTREGIKALNDQIMGIRAEFPFNMEIQISDDEWISAQTDALKEELHKLENYERELTLQYQQTISLL